MKRHAQKCHRTQASQSLEWSPGSQEHDRKGFDHLVKSPDFCKEDRKYLLLGTFLSDYISS